MLFFSRNSFIIPVSWITVFPMNTVLRLIANCGWTFLLTWVIWKWDLWLIDTKCYKSYQYASIETRFCFNETYACMACLWNSDYAEYYLIGLWHIFVISCLGVFVFKNNQEDIHSISFSHFLHILELTRTKSKKSLWAIYNRKSYHFWWYGKHKSEDLLLQNYLTFDQMNILYCNETRRI